MDTKLNDKQKEAVSSLIRDVRYLDLALNKNTGIKGIIKKIERKRIKLGLPWPECYGYRKV